MTAITYRQGFPPAVQAVVTLFERSGIRRPIHEPSRIEGMLANANLLVSAWHGDALVGLARALSDFSYCCYLSDLAVDRDFQHQGVGRQLIAQVRQAIGDEVSLVLLAAPEAKAYYPKLGFEQIDN